MKKYLTITSSVLASAVFAAGQNWKGGTAGNDLSEAANWSGGLSVIYDSSKTYTGGVIEGEADLNLWVRKDVPESSKITLSQDITSGRLGCDSSGKTIYFDFGSHALTLNGICGVALQMNSTNGKMNFLGGKVVIPYVPSTWYNTCLALSYNNNAICNSTVTIGGGSSAAEIEAGSIRLAYGTNNTIVVKDNGTLSCPGTNVFMGVRDVSGGVDKSSRGFRNGIILDGGRFVNTGTERKLVLGMRAGGSNYSKNGYFEIRPNSTLENVDYVTFNGMADAFVLNGAGVSFTQKMNSRWEIGNGNAVVVSNGASFLMDSGSGKASGSDRFWLNGGSKLVADGAGTVFRVNGSANATSLLGQGSNNNLIEVKNGARMILTTANNSGNVNIGQGSGSSHTSCQNNAVVVDGGVLVAGTFKVGGADSANKANFAQSNRYEIANGGIATNNNVYVSGDGCEDRYNTCLVSNRSSLAANYLVVGKFGYGNRFVATDHSTVTLNNDLCTGWDWTLYSGTNETVEVSDGAVVNVTGKVMDFGYGSEWIINDGKIVASELHLPRQGYGTTTPGTHVTLAGKNPVLKETAENENADLLVFRSSSRVTFRLPAGGYTEAPLQAPGGRLAAWTMTFDFDLSDLPEKLEKPYSTTLMSAKSFNFSIDKSAVTARLAAAIQAKYGDDVRKAKVTFGTTTVTASFEPKKGMVLIFR